MQVIHMKASSTKEIKKNLHTSEKCFRLQIHWMSQDKTVLTAVLPNVLVCLPALKDCPQHYNVLTQIFCFVPSRHSVCCLGEGENKRGGKQDVCFWKHAGLEL